MISDLDRSLGSRYFLNVANERTCFASCASAFKSSGLITFADSYFKQINGVAMGTKMGPSYANLFVGYVVNVATV